MVFDLFGLSCLVFVTDDTLCLVFWRACFCLSFCIVWYLDTGSFFGGFFLPRIADELFFGDFSLDVFRIGGFGGIRWFYLGMLLAICLRIWWFDVISIPPMGGGAVVYIEAGACSAPGWEINSVAYFCKPSVVKSWSWLMTATPLIGCLWVYTDLRLSAWDRTWVLELIWYWFSCGFREVGSLKNWFDIELWWVPTVSLFLIWPAGLCWALAVWGLWTRDGILDVADWYFCRAAFDGDLLFRSAPVATLNAFACDLVAHGFLPPFLASIWALMPGCSSFPPCIEACFRSCVMADPSVFWL